MDDFMIVDDNHHYIVEDERVIRNTREFLRTGAFLHDIADVGGTASGDKHAAQ
jgi:hypothetical protein